MHPVLSNISTELTAALHGLNPDQAQLHPPGKASGWSIQQIVEHLRLTYASSTQAINARIAKGRPTRARSTLNQRIARIAVVTLGLMPGRREAPPEVTPASSAPLSGGQILEILLEELDRLNTAAARAETIFASAPCATHFVLGPLSAASWRRFHRCHSRHHIRQINSARSYHRV